MNFSHVSTALASKHRRLRQRTAVTHAAHIPLPLCGNERMASAASRRLMRRDSHAQGPPLGLRVVVAPISFVFSSFFGLSFLDLIDFYSRAWRAIV